MDWAGALAIDSSSQIKPRIHRSFRRDNDQNSVHDRDQTRVARRLLCDYYYYYYYY